MPRRLTPSRVASGAVGRKPASTARPRHGPLVLRATRPGPTASIADDDTELFILSNGTVDYYAVLQVDDDASEAEIKAAYRNLAKICHPDFLGDAGHNICILLNEAYEVLMNPLARQAFNAQLEVALQDEEDGYTGEILSKWMPTVKPKMAKNTDPQESRAVFVDELSCIGCKMCVWCASATFRINPEHGRSRVFAQWLDTEEKIQQSIDSCPVDCIHWVDKEDLPALEYVCRFKTERVNVAHMMSNQGSNQDVFAMTEKFLKERRELEKRRQTAAQKASPMQEAARRKAAQEMAQRSSWFSMMGQQFADSFLGRGAAQSGDHNEPRVGRRKRARRSQPEEAILGGAGGTIPMERALVPCNRAEDI